jgi:uncharacterized protein YuzE
MSGISSLWVWTALTTDGEVAMKLVYDPDADAASIYLVDSIQPGGTARSHVCDVELTDCSVILDFDATDKLIGIEILGASRILPAGALENG